MTTAPRRLVNEITCNYDERVLDCALTPMADPRSAACRVRRGRSSAEAEGGMSTDRPCTAPQWGRLAAREVGHRLAACPVSTENGAHGYSIF